MTKTDVVILGAGPYGLAAAAHLRTIQGLEVSIFGKPMTFWSENMPVGMFLRSAWSATHIADPHSSVTLEAYQKASGEKFSRPVPIANFVNYGRWFQKQVVSELDERNIERIELDNGRFRVSLEDGEQLSATRVIIAAGIGSFARRPPEFDHLPDSLASHSSLHKDFRQFKGRRVLVVGGGQSALESAALLNEAGAEVEVIARTRTIHWLQGWASTTLHYGLGASIKKLLYAPTDVGPAVLSQLCARPDMLRTLPRRLQDRIRKRAVRPAGARWLVKRLEDVPIRLGRSVVSVAISGEKIKVRLDEGGERTVDHVLLGTGYRIDVSRYSFLAPELVKSLSRSNGFPRLGAGLETSISGLHILGAPAAWSFGPLMQFVSGTTYASRAVMQHIARAPRLS